MALDKTLNAEGMQALDLLKNSMQDVFDSVSANAYSALPSMLAQLGPKLTENKAVILAVSPKAFYNAKFGLRKALSLTLERSDDVTASLPTDYFPKTREEYEIVTGFPAGSKIFMTHNGLLTGFAIQSGKQTILFLPLEANRLFPMLRDDVCPYLKAQFAPAEPKAAPAAPLTDDELDNLFGEAEELDVGPAPAAEPTALQAAAAAAEVPSLDTVSDAVTEALPVEALPDPEEIAEEPAEAPAEEPAEEPIEAPAEAPAEEPAPPQDPLTAALYNAAAALNSTGKCTGVALCGPAEGLRTLLADVPHGRTAFIFDPEPAAKWNNGEFNTYFAEVTKTTLRRCGTDLAVAVSALYTDSEKDEKFMFFSLANEQGAKISKITENAQTDADTVACHCLQTMAEAITAAVNNPAAVAPVSAPAPAAEPAPIVEKALEDAPVIDEAAPDAPAVKVSKAPLTVAAILLGLGIVVAVVLGFVLSGRQASPAPESDPATTQAVAAESTTQPIVVSTLDVTESTEEETLDLTALSIEASEALAAAQGEGQ